MSRVAGKPIELPQGVEMILNDHLITIKGARGSLQRQLHPDIKVAKEDNLLRVNFLENIPMTKTIHAIAGTTRALLSGMVVGVTQGFERKLQLVGVGYRASAQGDVLSLTLGFSHPIKFTVPEGITVETPTQTEILVKGIDKQMVGQVAADIRAYRPPEPYKGKGVRYAGEKIVLKEGKKK